MDWTHRLRLRSLKMLHSPAQSRNVCHSAAMLDTSQLDGASTGKAALRDVGFGPVAVQEAMAALRRTVAEHAPDVTRA